MSLRRRIAAAVALAVAAVAAIMGLIGYLSVRSHLRGEIDHALLARAQTFLSLHDRGDRGPPDREPPPVGVRGRRSRPFDRVPNRPGPAPPLPDRGAPEGGPQRPAQAAPPSGAGVPAPLPFGGAPGYFQSVHADGTVIAPGESTPQLPVDARARAAARTGRGRYLTDVTVRGSHLRVLTIAGPSDHTAVQVARPLGEVDHVLRGLLFTFALLVGSGIVLAAALGGLIGRSALAPISRFTRRTEKVSGAPDRPERLEESGPAELVRLASSFNRTLDALERSVAAQRHLVADASHELRTPISALRSNIQIFLESHRLPAAERRALQEGIIAELDELTGLVSDVVELARSSDPNLEVEVLALDEIVAEAIERARRRAPELRFEVRLEPTLIRGTPERIARAVTNVLDNARKWSPSGGIVEVALNQGALSVRDRGPGFDVADLPHVFDRFYRAADARRLPGSGLGLAIVRQAAEAVGGSAHAENAPGGGALVRVDFGPTVTRGPAPAAKPDARPAPPSS